MAKSKRQRERETTGASKDRKKKEIERERDFLLHYSLYKDGIKFFTKIKFSHQEFDTLSDKAN